MGHEVATLMSSYLESEDGHLARAQVLAVLLLSMSLFFQFLSLVLSAPPPPALFSLWNTQFAWQADVLGELVMHALSGIGAS